jgi:hypothetical protein
VIRWLLLMPRIVAVAIDPYGDIEVQARAACCPLCAYEVSIVSKPVDRTADLYQAFLKERFSYTIGELNRAYGTDATSFTDLLTYDWKTIDPARTASDDTAFATQLNTAAKARAEQALRGCQFR